MEGITINELIAEIQAKYPSLAQSGDIDKSSILFTVINKMRVFGMDVLQLRNDFLKVVNSRAKLPEDFKSLKLAYNLDPKGYSVEGDGVGVTDNFIYKQRIENPAYFNDITKEYETNCDSKLVTEMITLGNSKLRYHYNHELLELMDGITQNSISLNCVNRGVKNSKKISISNNTLNTNFTEGKVYLEYYALPKNEDGELYIPIFSTGAIYNYIENIARTEITEYLINNSLNPAGLSEMYKVYKGQELGLKREAMTEAKFKGLGNNWSKTIKANNDRHFRKYGLR